MYESKLLSARDGLKLHCALAIFCAGITCIVAFRDISASVWAAIGTISYFVLSVADACDIKKYNYEIEKIIEEEKRYGKQ